MSTGTGILFFIVGPSGAGKDSLIDGARARLEATRRFAVAQRIITRSADAGGERHQAVTPAEFGRLRAAGGFLIAWDAHGLSYGLPIGLADTLAAGTHVIANGSRGVIAELQPRVRRLCVIEVTAPADVLAARLAARGREAPGDVASRLARRLPAPEPGLVSATVINDGSLADGIDRFVAALDAAVAARA